MRTKIVGIALIIGSVLAMPVTALAHVSMKADSTASGGYAYIQFSVPHGCEGKATNKVEIQIPEEVWSYKPQVNAGWTLESNVVKRDEPIKGPHGDITERVDTVTYTAKEPLPDGYLEVFGASVQWPEDAEGDQLNFPVIQTCDGGSTSEWIDIAKAGEDEPESPAPSITVTEAGDDAHGAGDDHKDAAKAEDKDTEHASVKVQKAEVSQSELDSVRVLAIVGVALGGVSVLLLLVLMGRVRRLGKGKDA